MNELGIWLYRVRLLLAVLLLVLLLFVSVLSLAACIQKNNHVREHGFPELRGEFLGQAPPGSEPQLFAPGIVSNGMTNRDVAISPDGREIFFGLAFGNTVTILHSRLVGERWTEPEIAPFARDPEFAYFEPAFSSDGQTLYFLSNRAGAGQEQQSGWGTQNIFAVERQGDGWGEPSALPAPITTDAYEYFPSVTRDGTLYFTRQERGGQPAIFRSRWVAGEFQEPEKLGPEINCGTAQYNAFIAPDESYLIVCVQGHERNIGPVDYYICFRDQNNQWSEAINLGEKINTQDARAISPSVSPDGRYFFFATNRTDEKVSFPDGTLTWDGLVALHKSPRNGSADIYWVDTAIFAELRPK